MAGSPTLEFTVDPDDMLVLDDQLTEPNFEELLVEPERDADVVQPPAETMAEAMPWIPALLEEGVVAYVKAKFDEKKHPRWPKGHPHAGEFMQIGQRFDMKGKTYEISAFTGGKIVAHLATGKGSETHEVVLAKDETGKVDAPTATTVKGSKSMSSSKEGAVTIDPFVDTASHDSSIVKPASLGLTDEQWARFGSLDQQHAIDLENRFGKWTPGKSKSLISELQKQYDSTIQQIISGALSSQYGSSSGSTLSLSSIFSAGPTPEQIKKYEQAKLLLRDTGEAIQWDLYHRCKGPDVAMFHWGGGNANAKRKQFAHDKQPIMSAYSWSTGAFATTGFGSTLTSVPMAIRHVEMHTHSGGVYTSFAGEYEVTTGARIILDDRAFFTSLSTVPSDVKKYLEKMAPSGGEPASGAILYEAAKAVKDPSYELPLPPEPPGLTAVPTAGSTEQYTKLPPDVAKTAGEAALKAGYSGGSKEAALGVLSQLGVKPGDFIEGLKGTRYIVIADPGDSQSNLRYVKIEPGTKLPNYSKSYPFSASGSNNFYRLDGHVEVPAPEKEKGFDGIPAEELAALKPSGPKKKIAAFSQGGKFVLDGEAYEVGAPHSSGKIEVTSLSTGTKYLVNSGYKTSPVLPDADYEPEPDIATAKAWKSGDRVLISSPGVNGSFLATVVAPPEDGKVHVQYHGGEVKIPLEHVGVAPKLPGETSFEVGDKFAFEGTPYTITSILKDGTVRAKMSGGTVQKFSKDTMGSTVVYRPSTFAIANSAKVGDLDVGDVVQGGAGAKIRPYVIVAKLDGKVHLRNLETGETSVVTKNKSYKRLLDAPAIAKQGEVTKPGEHKGPAKLATGLAPTGKWKPTNTFKPGEYMKIGEFTYLVGDKDGDGGQEIHVLADDGSIKKSMAYAPSMWNDMTVASEVWAPATPEQQEAKPELKSTFSDADWDEGPKAKLKDLPPGTIFVSATGLKMQLKSTSPKGGATAVALHNGKTVKNISYEKDFTTLVEKPPPPPSPPAFTADPVPKPKAVHVDGLEKHPGYATYLHPKSGKFKYPKLSDMPAGTVFTDKGGKAFKIHQSNGGAVAISDGQKIWQADPGWRGKVDAAVAFLDDATTAAPAADAGDLTVGHLKKGDTFIIPAGYKGAGDQYVVADPTQTDGKAGIATIKVKKMTGSGTGGTEDIATSLVPASVTTAPEAPAPAPEPAPVKAKPKPASPAEPSFDIGEVDKLPLGFVKNTAKTPFKDVPAGTFYAVDLGGEGFYVIAKVTKKTAAGSEVQTPYGTGVPDPEAWPDLMWSPPKSLTNALIGAQFSGELVASVPVGALVEVMQSDGSWGPVKFEHVGNGHFDDSSGLTNWTGKNLTVKVVGEAT